MVTSLLTYFGQDNYSLKEAMDEVKDQGASRRIPNTMVPEGIVPGKSKLFLAHAKAIVKVTAPDCTLKDLASALFGLWMMSQDDIINIVDELDQAYWVTDKLEPFDYVPGPMLKIAYTLSSAPPEVQRQLERDLQIVYCPGIFGWSTINGLEYVVKPGEDDLPTNLAQHEGYIKPVRPVYLDDPDDEATEEE
jgi:hypothetical protein